MAQSLAHRPAGLPSILGAPLFVDAWRSRAMLTGGIFTVLAIILAACAAIFEKDGFHHFLRAWLLGFMICFGFAAGAMALLMVQYCSGGKWGLIVRRPLEAMTRTFPLTFVYFLPVAIFGASFGQLYLWGRYPDARAALRQHLITNEQAHALIFKRPMLNTTTFWIVSLFSFAIIALYIHLLNKWSIDRDADPQPNVPYWQVRFENLSGFGIVVYAILLSAIAIYCVMSLDPTWYSTVYGLQFLVGQGYGVFALVILTLLGLKKAEPMHTMFRPIEQQDLGKFCFAFTMLNMYLAFAAFLIIWSGNSPEEIPWFLDRIRGNWGVIGTLDFMFHWLIPFSLLLSRSIKRDGRKLAIVCQIMIFARCWDMFWLIEPNFPDAARNLHISFGIMEYCTVPVALISFWMAYYFAQLKTRPLIATNDPHLVELLEAEHAHA